MIIVRHDVFLETKEATGFPFLARQSDPFLVAYCLSTWHAYIRSWCSRWMLAKGALVWRGVTRRGCTRCTICSSCVALRTSTIAPVSPSVEGTSRLAPVIVPSPFVASYFHMMWTLFNHAAAPMGRARMSFRGCARRGTSAVPSGREGRERRWYSVRRAYQRGVCVCVCVCSSEHRTGCRSP